MNSASPPWSALCIVALIAICACLLRVNIASSELLWLDELHTSWTVEGPLGEVASRAADGNQLPFYFWLSWFLVSVFEPSELSLRAISIIAGIGTLLTASWFTWRWTDSAIGAALVACLLAIDDQSVYCATEARPYALLQFLGVIQASLFCEVVWNRESNETIEPRCCVWPYWSLTLVSLLLMYTHLTSVWLLAAEVIYLGALWLSESIRRVISKTPSQDAYKIGSQLISTMVFVAVGCLPILLLTANVYERRENWQSISSISNLWSQSWPLMILLIGLPMAFLVGAEFLAKRLRAGAEASPNGLRRSRLGFVLLWSLLPIGFVVAMDYCGIASLALQRYTQVGAVGLPIFAGLCAGLVSNKSARLGLAGLVIAFAVSQNPLVESAIGNGQWPQLRFENWKSPISEINQTELKSRHPVFLFSNLIEDRDALQRNDAQFQNYLLFPVNGLYQLDDQHRRITAGPTLDRTHFDDDQVRSIKEQGGAWVIVRSAGRELVEEIGYEVQVRTAAAIGKQPETIRVRIMETRDSPVYLMSVDW